MKTKVTKELLKELGFTHHKDTGGWCYPDVNTDHAYVDDSLVGKFTLKEVVGFMITEEKCRLGKDIYRGINMVSGYVKGRD